MASTTAQSNKFNLAFWLHLVVTIGAWVAPFLLSWYIIVPIYALVVIQFLIFGRCLVNEKHELGEADDMTFYAYLFEAIGIPVNRKRLKWYVRRMFYQVLSVFTLIWQLLLGNEPLWF
jgi:hypothetical protein